MFLVCPAVSRVFETNSKRQCVRVVLNLTGNVLVSLVKERMWEILGNLIAVFPFCPVTLTSAKHSKNEGNWRLQRSLFYFKSLPAQNISNNNHYQNK